LGIGNHSEFGLPGLPIGKQVQAGNGRLEFMDYGLGVIFGLSQSLIGFIHSDFSINTS
jgi:hypothetical protein